MGGFEPPTSRPQTACSSQTELHPVPTLTLHAHARGIRRARARGSVIPAQKDPSCPRKRIRCAGAKGSVVPAQRDPSCPRKRIRRAGAKGIRRARAKGSVVPAQKDPSCPRKKDPSCPRKKDPSYPRLPRVSRRTEHQASRLSPTSLCRPCALPVVPQTYPHHPGYPRPLNAAWADARDSVQNSARYPRQARV